MGFKLLAEVGGQGERLEQYRQYKPPDSNCSHTQMSVLARRIMAQILVHTTDLDLTPLRHIALDLAPSPEIAKLLLSSSSSSHSAPLPPGFLRHLLLLAAREGWPGLGSPALTALHLMPPDQQAAELSAGGGGRSVQPAAARCSCHPEWSGGAVSSGAQLAFAAARFLAVTC